MESFTVIWNNLMVIAVFGGIVTSLVLLYALLDPKSAFGAGVQKFVGKHFLSIGFLIALAALVSSQIYEHVIGYAPCLLCWYARIAFYPQLILYGIALWKKERERVLDYAMGLTVFGLIISGYHYTVEMVGYSPLPCSAEVSCLTRYVYEYGFITIPFMGLVGFITLFLVLLTAKRAAK